MNGMDLLEHFSMRATQSMKQICDPMLSLLGVTHFNYIKVYHQDNSRANLTNRADWLDHFYKNALYQCLGTKSIEYLLPKGYFLWTELDRDDQVYKQGREYFDIDNGITLLKKDEDFTELYVFASTRTNEQINTFYIKNIDLLHRFIFYFNDKARKLIKEANNRKIFIPSKEIILQKNDGCDQGENGLRDKFIYGTDINRYFIGDNVYLTKREAECVTCAMDGYSSKEIARFLGISYRTVEEYLDKAREKLKCFSRKELIGLLSRTGLYSAVSALNENH